MLTVSINTLIVLFLIISITVLVPFLYVKVVSGLVNRVLSRIISTNFTVSLDKMGSLIFGYSVGTIIFASIIYHLYLNRFISINQSLIPTVVSASALCFCFTARVITREYGHTYGKQYLSVVSTLSSILLIIKILISVNSLDISTINLSAFDIQLIQNIYGGMYNVTKETLELLKNCFGFIVVGVLSSASVGEMLLGRSNAHNRSITAAFEKLDLGLIPIPTKKEADEMMKEITSTDVKSIKLITRTLTNLETLSNNIRPGIEFKVIAPDLSELPEYSSNKGYIIRLNNLKEYSKNDDVVWSRSDFNSLRALIVNDKKLMLIVRSGDTRGRKCCLYSEDTYVVKHFVQIFDGFFESSKTSKEQPGKTSKEQPGKTSGGATKE